METHLTATRARLLLSYDPDSGIIRRKVRLSNSVQVGDIAGCLHPKGYFNLYVDGHRYRSHRVAWLLYYGEWPKQVIDHINRVRSDNRIENLRDVSIRENTENISKFRPNSSGLAGVSWMSAANKWRAQIAVKRQVIYLGIFTDKEEAHAAYLMAKRKLHSGCTI